MKKLFTILTILIATSGLFAQDFEVDGIGYNIIFDNTLEVTVPIGCSSDCYYGDIEIPREVTYDGQTYTVTSISYDSFSECSGLTSIIIPNSVSKIEYLAFYKCTSLTSIFIPNSINSIEEKAFLGCDELEYIEVENGNTNYKSIDGVLYNYNNAILIQYPSKKAGSFVIPSNVNKIESYSFGNCSYLSSIVIPNSVSIIGESAFQNCTGLTSIVIPNSVTSIGSGAFLNCNNLISVTMPNNITSIEYRTFFWCYKLKKINIPNNVTRIDLSAFHRCYMLDSIIIPNSVTTIGQDAFWECNSLKSVQISKFVTSIGLTAFGGCAKLDSINVELDNPNYLSIDGVLFSKDSKKLIQCPGNKKDNYIIPNTTISIEPHAFESCDGLTSLLIPNTITNIKSRALSFCDNIKSIICLQNTPPILENEAFYYIDFEIPLYVPYKSVNLYKQASQWKKFKIQGIIPNIGSGDYCVSGNVYLDENENGIKDINEFSLSSQEILILPDSIYTGTDENGNYYFRTSSGSYEVKLLTKDNWQLTTDSVSYKVIVNNSDTSGFDFGIKGINEETKLETYITSLDGGRCSQASPFYLTYKNIGTTVSSGLLTLNVDEKLKDILSSESAYDSVSTDTSFVYWNYTNLKPFEERRIILNITMPDFTAMGDTLISYSTIDNGITVQNSDTSKVLVTCSYDPNDKLVYPEGVYEENYVLMDETLNYTIRFQNTGNDTAYHVIVIDTLDSSLDLNTFEVLSSSHNLQTSYTKDGIVEFRFDSIMLVDSTTNQPESQGFVKYKIKAKSGLDDNTVVKNTGYIYFDSNPPVITNTTINTMTYNISKLKVEEQAKQKDKVNFYPNPFSQTAKLEFENKNNEPYQLQITDITGKLLQSQQSKSNIMIIEKGNMPSGMYFYKLQNTLTKESYNGKFVVE